jgi:hypothetical protein
MKTPFYYIALLLGVVTVAPLAAEAALRAYASYYKRDRLLRSDAQTGWSNVPNFLGTRINAEGEVWSIQTDQNGQRIITQSPGTPKNRILILGDSLSFGEGVEIEDRFDVKVLSSLSNTRVINTGVMGYGTDQEYVAFRNWKRFLEAGDVVLIVLNKSDYFDVLRRRYFGRAKPYLEKNGGSFVLRPPRIGFWERWSDSSRLASVVARLLEPAAAPENFDLRRSIEIIQVILRRVREEAPRGVRVVLAHQGTHDLLVSKLGLSSTLFCQFADICVDLDDALNDPVYLLPDGHWSASGHAVVAQALLKALRD